MSRPPFRIEYQSPDGRWFAPAGSADTSLMFLRGIMAERGNHSPRCAARIVRGRDGKVMEADPGGDAPEIGMVAGRPSAAQLIRAAVTALRQVPRPDPDAPSSATPDEMARVRAALFLLTSETSEIP